MGKGEACMPHERSKFKVRTDIVNKKMDLKEKKRRKEKLLTDPMWVDVQMH